MMDITKKDFTDSILEECIEYHMDYTFHKIVMELNKGINTIAEDCVDMNKDIDINVEDEIINLTVDYAKWVGSDMIETGMDICKQLNEMDDDEFIEKMFANPNLYGYRANPSEKVEEAKKLIEL